MNIDYAIIIRFDGDIEFVLYDKEESYHTIERLASFVTRFISFSHTMKKIKEKIEIEELLQNIIDTTSWDLLKETIHLVEVSNIAVLDLNSNHFNEQFTIYEGLFKEELISYNARKYDVNSKVYLKDKKIIEEIYLIERDSQEN